MNHEIEKNILRHCKHHWLWGLHIAHEPLLSDSLYQQQLQLLQNQAELSICLTAVNQYAQRPSWLRAVWWFFNINNCRYQVYRATALYALHPEHPMLDNQPHPLQTMLQNTWQQIRQSFERQMSQASAFAPPDSPTTPETEAAAEEVPQAPLPEVKSAPQVTEAQLSLSLTQQVRRLLAVLNIHPPAEQQQLEFAEIRKAYRKQALTSHPDKGGSTEAFTALQNAYEQLKALLKTTEPLMSWEEFEARLDKLEKMSKKNWETLADIRRMREEHRAWKLQQEREWAQRSAEIKDGSFREWN